MARPTLFTHPKFRRLCHDLSLSRPTALGHMELLWRVAYESGEALIGDATDVELAAEWDREPGLFAATLLRLRFLDERDGSLAIHDLADHEPEYVKDRRKKERQRRAKGVQERELTRHQEGRERELPGKLPGQSREVAGKESDLSGTPAPAPAPAQPLREEESLTLLSSPEATPRNGKPTPADLMDVWNQHCGTLAKAKDLNAERERHARARLKEHPSLEEWAEVATKLSRSPWCLGGNDRGWRADFDFFVKATTFSKSQEGAYDDRQKRPSVPQTTEGKYPRKEYPKYE